MNRKRIVYAAAAAVVLAGLVGAALHALRWTRRQEESGLSRRVVTIQGLDGCWNMSLSIAPWCARLGHGLPSLPARDGDLLFVPVEPSSDGDGYVVPYLRSDGVSLTLTVAAGEKTAVPQVLLGAATVSLVLCEPAWRWLDNATREELERLRFLWVDDLPEPQKPEYAACMRALKKLAEVNPGVGLSLGEDYPLGPVLSLFHPRWLILVDRASLKKEDLEAISSRQGLEELWIDVSKLESLDFLARLRGLRRLVVKKWHPEKTGPFPAGCDSLESLVLDGPDVEDISSIAKLTGLRELGIGEEFHVAALSGFSGLDLSDESPFLSSLKKLKGVTSLALPEGITQEGFAAAIGDHPGIRSLQLVGCREIKDLSPLKGLPELEHLVLFAGPKASGGKEGEAKTKLSRAPLHELKSLRYLMLPTRVFAESPAEVRKLEEALPQCTVSAGGEPCLGSGWLLAIFPLLAVIGLLSRRRRSTRGAKPTDA
jgi:hypothetical protein